MFAITNRRVECNVSARLASHDGVFVPVPGFGNSDCHVCAAHLYEITVGTRMSEAETRVMEAFEAEGLKPVAWHPC